MLERLRGKLIEKNFNKIVVETGGGLGLALMAPLSTTLALPQLGTEVILETRLVLREESVELFGFLTKAERESFDILTSVSRIGPRLAITIISAIEPKDLAQALVNQDLDRLSAIKGIGKKTAERILVELKDKAKRLADVEPAAMGGESLTGSLTPYSEVLSALRNLGYTQAEANSAVSKASKELGTDASLEDLLRDSLKRLSS
jgi:Holliday junction DNA helicase RuvA